MGLPGDLLFDRFLSLGDNCEFGLVQRRCGGQAIGLFNFASTTIDSLLHGLDTRFRAIASGSMTVSLTDGREYYVTLTGSAIGYHTGISEDSMDLVAIKEQERRRLVFLSRKFVEDLEDGEKILSTNPTLRPALQRSTNWFPACAGTVRTRCSGSRRKSRDIERAAWRNWLKDCCVAISTASPHTRMPMTCPRRCGR